ncbi:relaxase/mobilization nuclease domain-containing protein [Tissierella carlieri]|uniref:relaxase/mobilization nuclease domain-containing protein n=1 Tax=Tissierella carlieri TaxID=689904 RepID=UPI00386559FA
MAIVKFINGKNEKKEGLVRAIDYILDENKTEIFNSAHEDAEELFIDRLINENKGSRAIRYITKDSKTTSHLITGINCSPESAFDEMMITKQMYNKENGRQFIHFTHSYSDKEKISPELAHEISLRLLDDKRFKGFEILAATHVDKGHIHTHFILNTVNTETGKKWRQSNKELEDLKKYSNQLCAEYGLKHSFVDPKKQKTNSKSTGQYRAEQKKSSWIRETYLAVKECSKTSISKEDFIKQMNGLGYRVRWEDTRKDITFTNPDGKKRNSDKLYPQDKFTKDALLKRFELNKQFREKNRKWEKQRIEETNKSSKYVFFKTLNDCRVGASREEVIENFKEFYSIEKGRKTKSITFNNKNKCGPEKIYSPIDLVIKECARISMNKIEFINNLKSLGYEVEWKQSSNNLKFILPNKKEYTNSEYTKQSLLKDFEKNKSVLRFVRSASKIAKSKDEFIKLLNDLGHKVRWEENIKEIKFTSPDGRKFDNDKVYPSERYTKEALLKKFEQNKQWHDRKKEFESNRIIQARNNLILETIRHLGDDPEEGNKSYPLSYLEGQALKEKMIEKSKGEGLDWEKEKER